MSVRNPDRAVVFDYHLDTTFEYWRRFGGVPAMAGKRVLDFGCGTGGMVRRLLDNGAAEVVGVDISERAVEYGRERMADFGNRVTMFAGDIRNLDIGDFDMIVSQNNLEHVMPLEPVIEAVVAKARPGADIYFGFSPLWYSHYGHHGYPQTRLPWYRLLMGEKSVLDSMHAVSESRYTDIFDAGFDKLVPSRFDTLFRALPVEIVSFQRNVVTGGWKQRIASLAAPVAQLPILEKYLTVSMYAHLRKR